MQSEYLQATRRYSFTQLHRREQFQDQQQPTETYFEETGGGKKDAISDLNTVTWHTGGSTLHKTLNLTTAPNNLPRN
jgi:hypothetical protein